MSKQVKIYRFQETTEIVNEETDSIETETTIFECNVQYVCITGNGAKRLAKLKAGHAIDGWKLLGWYMETVNVEPWDSAYDKIDYDSNGKPSIELLSEHGELQDGFVPIIYRSGDAIRKNVELTTLENKGIVSVGLGMAVKVKPCIVWSKVAIDAEFDERKMDSRMEADSFVDGLSSALDCHIKVYELPTLDTAPSKEYLVNEVNTLS